MLDLVGTLFNAEVYPTPRNADRDRCPKAANSLQDHVNAKAFAAILYIASILDMSSLLRIVNRTATRRLQQKPSFPRRLCGKTPAKSASYSLQTSKSHPTASSRSTFSTMTPLKSNAPAMVGVREFDPEIKDMASYIHNYKIDSDLAVCEESHQTSEQARH